MYHPMLACGDFDLMAPLFRMYENVRALAEARSAKYYGTQGAYFPETMTVFGTYGGADYGWERKGKEPKDVRSPYRKFQVLKQVIAVVKSSFATLWPRILELLPSGYNAAAVAELFRHLDLSQLQQPFDLLASLGH